MIIYDNDLINQPVLSLQTGRPIAKTNYVIIDPDKLSIAAFELSEGLADKDSFLLTRDIREHSQIGFIINSSDEIVNSQDIIYLKSLLEKDFQLIGTKVVTESGQKIGKVKSYSTIYGLYLVYQLIIKRSFVKSLFDNELIIDREAIVDIKPDRIIINDEFEQTKVSNQIIKNQQLPNPFRAKKPKSIINN